MAEAKRRIPHFTLVEEFDVTALEDTRAMMNKDRGGNPKLTDQNVVELLSKIGDSSRLSGAKALEALTGPDVTAAERVKFLYDHHILDIVRQFPVKGVDAASLLSGLRPLCLHRATMRPLMVLRFWEIWVMGGL